MKDKDLGTEIDLSGNYPRNVFYNSSIIKYKNLKYISRPDKPHEMNLDQLATPTPLASPSEKKESESGREKKKMSGAERREMFENIMRDNSERMLAYANELFVIKLSLSKQKKPDRITVNMDVIFNPGDRYPFKLSADCVNRTRSRELLSNVRDSGYWGYHECVERVKELPVGQGFIGKFKNRSLKNFTIPRRIVSNTCVMVYVNGSTLWADVYIGDVKHTIELQEEFNLNALKHYTHRGMYQNERDESW